MQEPETTQLKSNQDRHFKQVKWFVYSIIIVYINIVAWWADV